MSAARKPPLSTGAAVVVLAWRDPAIKQWSLLAFATEAEARAEIEHLPDPSAWALYTSRVETVEVPT